MHGTFVRTQYIFLLVSQSMLNLECTFLSTLDGPTFHKKQSDDTLSCFYI